MLAAIEGPDILIVIAVVLLLFGSTQIPKLARSLGSASKEFKRGQDEGRPEESTPTAVATVVATTADAAPVVAAPIIAVPASTAAAPAAESTAANGPDSTTPVR